MGLWTRGNLDPERPCMITCALSGVVANRAQCPAIPYRPEEYAAEARRAYEAGAAAARSRHWSRPIPITSQSLRGGSCATIASRFGTVGGAPPSTPRIRLNWYGGASSPMSTSGNALPTWPTSKHSSSGFVPAARIASRIWTISEKGFANTRSKTSSFRPGWYFA